MGPVHWNVHITYCMFLLFWAIPFKVAVARILVAAAILARSLKVPEVYSHNYNCN